MIVKHRLPVLMAAQGIRTVQDLIRLIGFDKDRAVYRFYNNEVRTYDPELLAAICKALNCKIDDLLYLDEQAIS